MFKNVLLVVVTACAGIATISYLIFAGPSPQEEFDSAKANFEIRLMAMMGGNDGCATEAEISAAVEEISVDPFAFQPNDTIRFVNCAFPVFENDVNHHVHYLQETFSAL